MNDGKHWCGLYVLGQQERSRLLRCFVHGGCVERTEWRRRRTEGRARLKLRKSRVLVAFIDTITDLLTRSPSSRCRPSQSCSSLNQSRSTMPCTPQSRCAPIPPFSSRRITRSLSGVRMHGSRYRGYAPSRRLLRQCHSNIEGSRRGQG